MLVLRYVHRINIHPTAIVCREAVLEGNVRIGAGTVVHPFAIIKASNGPILIGENNIIEERSLIENIIDISLLPCLCRLWVQLLCFYFFSGLFCFEVIRMRRIVFATWIFAEKSYKWDLKRIVSNVTSQKDCQYVYNEFD
ncbi:bacterial transferase hexapeptide repeat protein [Dictyocaulus viviparus]|uniref:Dynactin subunit 6 n=1 Tax=Dictyocaulus viviparus TaxID=29172 RepID=A0A0D8Y6Y8_DICVI|nr:bacterial transferase hexapeptide repeat protein [Dictyocaulus viviparus]